MLREIARPAANLHRVSGDHNRHWDQLAQSGQSARLAQEIDLWRSQFRDGLRAHTDLGESVRPLLEDLDDLDCQQLTQDWQQGRERLAGLNQDGQLLREDYLQQLGPTPLPFLNSLLLHVDRLAAHSDQLGAVGAGLFADLRQFEAWAGSNSIHGEAYESLRLWIENMALGLLSGSYPRPDQARKQLTEMWDGLSQEHARQVGESTLSGPTQSARWNSWVLLLELCEHETQDYAPVLDSLDALEEDVEEIARALGDRPEVVELVTDFRETSQQLREAMTGGKKLKGWTQIISGILVELDNLVPRDALAEAPVSRVRSLCQEFEAGGLSTEQFHRQLEQFAESLTEIRRQSRITAAQHPSEAAFLEALGKLQGGLDILTGVERSGQASRLEMGCTLVEEGLDQIHQLEAGNGR